MTEAQGNEFMALAKPLMAWLNVNGNPHMSIIIDCTTAEVVSGEAAFYTEEFLVD